MDRPNKTCIMQLTEPSHIDNPNGIEDRNCEMILTI